jgi:GDP-L-fucose synthase
VRFISDNLLRAMKRQPMSIDNQNVTFDYLHVSDLASILAHFIEHKPSHRFYNATPDVSVDLLTIAKTINQVTGQDLPIHIGKSGMAPEYSGNNARLRQEMPDLSFTPLEMGIRKLYEWYQQHPPQQP